MFDRSQAPQFQTIQHVTIPAIQAYTLDNGLPLRVVNAGEQPVLRLELIFPAGGWYETSPGAAYFGIRMLGEGTRTRTAAQISEAFDQYGAFPEFSPGNDRANLTTYCLARHLPTLLPVIQDILHESVFPEKELETLKSISLQTLKVNLEKTAYVASQHLREGLFGADHPYGRNQSEALIASISQQTVREFYDRRIAGKPFTLFLSGRVSEHEVALLNQAFGQEKVSDSSAETSPKHSVKNRKPTGITIERPDSLQSSIRLGKRLFTRRHPDYFKFMVLNEVFGGYFGSRLMKNIREEKGFTYGISSNLTSMAHEGYFVLGTDVKKENTAQTLEEIAKEIARLQTEPVPADELETVQNYMIGSFVGALNTPFEIADRQKTVYFDDLPANFYQTYVEHIRAVTSDDVRDMARQYLDVASMQEVVVGGK
ncbi:MAG: insulinase family protein [Cytophagaceae bacterium]|nr:insulinase family protein [Cytophagaceae bacterium]